MSEDDLDALLDGALDDMDAQDEVNEKERQQAAEELMKQEATLAAGSPLAAGVPSGGPPGLGGMPGSGFGEGAGGNEAEMMQQLMQAFGQMGGGAGGPDGMPSPPTGGMGGLHELLENTIKQLEDGASEDEKQELSKCKQLVGQLGEMERNGEGADSEAAQAAAAAGEALPTPPPPTAEDLALFEKLMSEMPKPPGAEGNGEEGQEPATAEAREKLVQQQQEALKEIIEGLEKHRKETEEGAAGRAGHDATKCETGEVDKTTGNGIKLSPSARGGDETADPMRALEHIREMAAQAQQQVAGDHQNPEDLSPEEVEALVAKLKEELSPEQQQMLETISEILSPDATDESTEPDGKKLTEDEKAKRLQECLEALGKADQK